MNDGETSWVILGCGYTGQHLAARLKEAGHSVIVTSRHVEKVRQLGLELGVGARQVDVYEPSTLADWIPDGAIVVDSVPTNLEKGPHTKAVVEAAAEAKANRVVYLSSTSVYPLGDGSWVDEETPTIPDSDKGKARIAEEKTLHEAGDEFDVETVALRIAAIYGPGRGVASRMRAGTYRLVEDAKGMKSRIHVSDLSETIARAGLVEPLVRNTYVVADDEPSTSESYATEVARVLGMSPPERISLKDLPPEHQDMVRSNRQVLNSRIKTELGVRLRFPTWREGLRSAT